MKLESVVQAVESIEGRVAFAAAAVRLISLCRSEALVFSDVLDRSLYGSDAFVEVLKGMLLSSERARLSLLVNRGREAAGACPRLIELAQTLSSRCEIRQVGERSRDRYRGEWLIADRRHALLRRGPDAVLAEFYRDTPSTVRPYVIDFESLWSEALPSPELRSLNL